MSDRDRRDDEELARAAEDLARELRAHRERLEREAKRRGPPRGPLGLPRPPTPREVLEFADEFAIPTIIAILEANIKLLEGLRAVIRMADAGREARDRTRRTGENTADRASELGRATLSQLENSLSDLRTAIEGGGLSGDREGQELLEDIRELQGEIDDRLQGSREGSSRSSRPSRRTDGRDGARDPRDRRRLESAGGDGRDGGRGDSGGGSDEGGSDGTRSDEAGDATDERDDGVDVDVDAELDSLRERYRGDEGDDEDDAEA